MIPSLLLSIGLLLTPHAYAQEASTDIYSKIRERVEQEFNTEEADLTAQRFSLGVYYDHPLNTTSSADETVQFDLLDEGYVDLSLQQRVLRMCGNQEDRNNQYTTCIQAQRMLRQAVDQTIWSQALGRELQAIASGYEAGIEGYPGKTIDVIAKFAGIAHMWRATNDPFVSPILEVLTRARPWPQGIAGQIENKAKEAESAINSLEIQSNTTLSEDEVIEKTDRTQVTAAIWRYRHGVRYVKEHEGDSCEQFNSELDTYFNCVQATGDEALCNADFGANRPDPSMAMLQQRWCNVENQLEELSDLIQQDQVEVGNDEHIIYPSHINKEKNIYIWMRRDDVGLQPYIPLEPVQATLYHPDYGDCIENRNIRDCYEDFSQYIVRGGKYPSKLGDEQRRQQPSIMGGGTVPDTPADAEERDVRSNNSIVKEPDEGDGICSHPFGKRGYLCRNIEYEACDLTAEQQEQLLDAGTGGIVLTRCEPERFYDDVARRVSGSNICGIGGWRETVPENLVEDTPEKQPDMRVPACSKCWVDVVCQDECSNGGAFTYYEKRNDGIIDVCVPNNPPGKGDALYLLAHELIHAQQICHESNLQSLDRAGLTTAAGQGAAACCASEREAYFVQCKLMALDGILDAAGVTIDQCASAYANFSCQAHDENTNDDEYVCSNDGINPGLVSDAINSAKEEIADLINLPSTCAEALNHPRIRALYNSMPPSCEPGCEAQYQNTIGNNLCYTGQCMEETHEFARDIPGRVALSEVEQGFPWDACERPDPKLGDFEVAPALTGPKFPLYRPALLLQQLDMELCQINGLPASTPPVICGFDPRERLGLPPLNLLQAAGDLALQPEQYDATGLGIQYSAAAIASRVTTDMFIQYMKPASRHLADLLNTMFDVFNGVGELEFPQTMCPRYTDENFSCDQLQQ